MVAPISAILSALALPIPCVLPQISAVLLSSDFNFAIF
jgi:hypothetical protein